MVQVFCKDHLETGTQPKERSDPFACMHIFLEKILHTPCIKLDVDWNVRIAMEATKRIIRINTKKGLFEKLLGNGIIIAN